MPYAERASPLSGRRADLLMKPTTERARTHRCPLRERLNAHRRARIFLHPAQQGLQRGRRRWQLVDDVLRLPAVTLEGCYRYARRLGGDARPKIATHEMQAHVEASSGAGRRDDLAVVDVQHSGLNGHCGIACAQARRGEPMRRRAYTVQKAGRRKHEGTRANRCDAGAASRCGSQRPHHRRRNGRFNILDAGDHDRLGARDDIKPMARVDIERC